MYTDSVSISYHDKQDHKSEKYKDDDNYFLEDQCFIYRDSFWLIFD